VAKVFVPAAKDHTPLAVVFAPKAADEDPTLGSSHWLPLTIPARSAACRGYHMSRVPGPLTGMFPVPQVPAATRPSSFERSKRGVGRDRELPPPGTFMSTSERAAATRVNSTCPCLQLAGVSLCLIM
jgi:hypothetical protein